MLETAASIDWPVPSPIRGEYPLKCHLHRANACHKSAGLGQEPAPLTLEATTCVRGAATNGSALVQCLVATTWLSDRTVYFIVGGNMGGVRVAAVCW